MGKMTLLITGASGYVGRYTVAAARARNHNVVAHVRHASSAPIEWRDDPLITLASADLTDDKELASLTGGVDAVIHTAASLAGNESEQKRDTLNATNALTRAISQNTAKPRLVLISSMAVYSGGAPRTGEKISETSALEKQPGQRDLYCRTKLLQEAQACDAARSDGFELWILRAGAVYGPSRLWNAHVGVSLGPIYLRLGNRGEIPLIHVGHCAEILVRAAETPVQATANSKIEYLNVIDDDLPDRPRFLSAISKSGWPLHVAPLSWKLLTVPAFILQRVPFIKTRLPGLMRIPVLKARMRALEFDNTKLHTRLDWYSRDTFEDLMASAIASEKVVPIV